MSFERIGNWKVKPWNNDFSDDSLSLHYELDIHKIIDQMAYLEEEAILAAVLSYLRERGYTIQEPEGPPPAPNTSLTKKGFKHGII